jgi:glutaredoxin
MEAPRTRIVIGAYLRQKGICPYCQRSVTTDNATWEHVIPRAWGGPNVGSNVVLACQACNSAKSALESFISNNFGRELDMGSRAALFVLRCMKLNRLPYKKRRLPQDTYLRMAEDLREAADAWIRAGRVTIPELTDKTRGAFI